MMLEWAVWAGQEHGLPETCHEEGTVGWNAIGGAWPRALSVQLEYEKGKNSYRVLLIKEGLLLGRHVPTCGARVALF